MYLTYRHNHPQSIASVRTDGRYKRPKHQDIGKLVVLESFLQSRLFGDIDALVRFGGGEKEEESVLLRALISNVFFFFIYHC